jgi:hypothetical protein
VQLQVIVPQQQAEESVRWHTKSPLIKCHKGHHVSLRGRRERGVLWHAAGCKLCHRHEPLDHEALQVTLRNLRRGLALFCHGLRRKEKQHSPSPDNSLFFFLSPFFSLFLFRRSESASSPLVDFGVLNDNLIKGLISCVKCINRLLVKVFIDASLEVQL